MRRFEDRIVLITGGETGIGKTTAHRFADEGARVVIGGINEEEGERTCLDIGKRSIFRKVDVTRSDEVEDLVKETIRKWHRIDVLFANAGVFSKGKIEEVEEEEWDRESLTLI